MYQLAHIYFFCIEQDMKSIFIRGCLLAALIGQCMSDMYLHFPPGSNNRLNGADENVQNSNRLFNSQVICNFYCMAWYVADITGVLIG